MKKSDMGGSCSR